MAITHRVGVGWSSRASGWGATDGLGRACGLGLATELDIL